MPFKNANAGCFASLCHDFGVYEADGMRGMLGRAPVTRYSVRASDTTDRDPRDTTIVDISCVALRTTFLWHCGTASWTSFVSRGGLTELWTYLGGMALQYI